MEGRREGVELTDRYQIVSVLQQLLDSADHSHLDIPDCTLLSGPPAAFRPPSRSSL